VFAVDIYNNNFKTLYYLPSMPSTTSFQLISRSYFIEGLDFNKLQNLIMKSSQKYGLSALFQVIVVIEKLSLN